MLCSQYVIKGASYFLELFRIYIYIYPKPWGLKKTLFILVRFYLNL